MQISFYILCFQRELKATKLIVLDAKKFETAMALTNVQINLSFMQASFLTHFAAMLTNAAPGEGILTVPAFPHAHTTASPSLSQRGFSNFSTFSMCQGMKSK